MAITAKKLFRGDKIIWVVIVILSLLSAIEVYSSLGKAAYDHGWSVYGTIFRHLRIVLISYAVMILISHLQLNLIKKLSLWGFVLCVGLMLILVGMAFVSMVRGASGGHAAFRWIDDIPIIGQFQPSEIAKYMVIIFLSSMLVKYRDKLKEPGTFKRLMFPVVLISGLIFPENFSTSALVFISCMVLMFLAGVNYKYLLWTFLIVLGLVGVFLFLCFVLDLELFRSSTWVKRIDEWLSPEKDKLTQTNIAKIAIAVGGGRIFGRGIGNTVQGRFLNESHTDFIYSVITEEMGILFALAIIALYVWFFIRCMAISRNSSTMFGQLVVAGLGFLIFLQALINMGVATGYLPVTGQTLPLISYGGTSYVLTCSAIGVILAVSHRNKIDSMETTSEKQTETEDNNTENTTEDESNN